MRIAWLVVAALWCVLMASSWAGEFRVPLMTNPPTIDGFIKPEEWAAAAGFDGLQFEGSLKQRRAQCFVGATEDALFVAIKSQLPDEGSLVSSVTSDSLKAVYDDSVEVYVCPDPTAERRVVYQFLVNSLGKGGYNVHLVGGASEEASWRGNWQHSHGLHNGWWHFECKVPVSSMSVAPRRKTTEGLWGINLTRNWKEPWEWSSLTGGYAEPLAIFRFVPEGAPAVAYEASSDPFLTKFDGKLRLANPSRKELEIKASLILTRNRMPTLSEERTFRLPPGGKTELVLRVPEDDATTRFELAALVSSGDGKTVYYERKIAWPRGKPYRWVVGKKAPPPPLDFRFAYYPYLNEMRIQADISGLPAGSRLSRLTATVRKKGGAAVKTLDFPVADFKDGRQERSLELPPLEGEYEIALKAEGEGVPTGEVVKGFERKRFPWEHTSLGTSKTVYPPFEPIRLRGNKLRTVLREHTLNGLGLWDQVEAASSHTRISKPILAAPMRYAVKLDGKSLEPKPSRLRTLSSAPHEAILEGGFTAGPLKAVAKTSWDYDGTVRVDLTLGPTGDSTLEALDLEIPFRADVAVLLHANSDRIRAPIAMRIPQKDGLIWDATKLACDEYIKNFCPYVYVGGPARGLAFFAENDRGWSWDPSKPNMEVSRDGDKVVLRVHLVSKPITIREPRTLSFGLLAAPVKPRLSPDGPNWWRYRYYRDGYRLLGTDINWLALGDCGSVYPAGCDMYLWEMLARGNRERLSDTDIDAVIARGRKYFEPYGEEKVKSFEAHARHNLRTHLGGKMIFYYNRASCQLFDEFETFKDEWSLDDLRAIGKGNGIWEIKIVPSKSYIDHALYWYAKSFEIGANKGVYWDNFFICPTFNTRMTDAYRREDGSIVPAAGIWALRELCKRTFVMMNEKGMLPVTFPHMTSFAPLPMLAFATVQYDWEWQYSMGDVQDRFTRELILLTTTGEQAGVWPVPLHDHGPLAEHPWTQRTFVAVRLVHELDGYGGLSVGENKKLLEPILKLLDEPGLEVYRYWDDRPQPVSSGNPDLPAIVYSLKGREAVAAVTSYSQRDEDVELSVDLPALGFAGGCKVVDVETLAELPIRDGKLHFRLKRHDVKVLRFTSAEGRTR